MNVYEIDPTADPRWRELLEQHDDASIFHSRGWMEALRRTYGYIPTVFTTSPPGSPLTHGIAFCKVGGWATRRLVSLPFSDHCTPLVETQDQMCRIAEYLREKVDREHWRYFEVRSGALLATADVGNNRGTMVLHRLDLKPKLDSLYAGLHGDCVKRKIRGAERQGIRCEEGRSSRLLLSFYRLLVMTRRRHGLPPQPFAWFENLAALLEDRMQVSVAFHCDHPVAAIVTLKNSRITTYKYGGSDARFHNLGGMQLLLWRAIRQAREEGSLELDMGRSEVAHEGLIRFKERWGAVRSELVYARYPAKSPSRVAQVGREFMSRYVWSRAPLSALAFAGRAIYKYAG